MSVIDQLLDELQSAGVFGTALLNNVQDFNYYKEQARPIIAKYLAPAVALDKLDTSESKLVRVQVSREDDEFLVIPWYRLKDGKVVSVPPDSGYPNLEEAIAEFNRLWSEANDV